MSDSKDTNLKEVFIREILQDINDVPIVYLRTLTALIHTFKENILTVERLDIKQDYQEDNFDWDDLIDSIHTNRQRNNERLHAEHVSKNIQ